MTSNVLARKEVRFGNEEELIEVPPPTPDCPIAPEAHAEGGGLPLPPRHKRWQASFPQVGEGRAHCTPPAGETCVCDWNPSYQCYYAATASDPCQCWSYGESACADRGGSFCTRPASCVEHCDLCADASTCQQCASGYMAVGGLCTLAPATYAEMALKTHNIYRCAHGAQALAWSSAAAASAQTWADSLTSLEHSPSYSEPPPAGPAGENLAKGYGDIVAATSAWYNEVDCCSTLADGATFSDGCKTGSCTVGHFTALIWAGATELGCARNTGAKIDVCRYRSGDTLSKNTANMGGYYVEMVQEKEKPIEQCIAEMDGAPPTTAAPTPLPTPPPTPMPTMAPTGMPTPMPTAAPTAAPTPAPTLPPMTTEAPTMAPTQPPTSMPTVAPTEMPTPMPTMAPTQPPTPMPTVAPTEMPTPMPSLSPTPAPATSTTTTTTRRKGGKRR